MIKYPIDGQKVEKRLSSEVNKENNRIKSISKSYLSCSGDNVDYNSVINIDSSNKFWNDNANEDAAQHIIPLSAKQQIIHAVLMIRRSCEEKESLKRDMHNSISFLEQKIQTMEKAVERIDRSDPYTWQEHIAFLNKRFFDGSYCY